MGALHTLQSTLHPELSCWVAQSSPGANEVSLALTHWQNPLYGELRRGQHCCSSITHPS